MKTWQPGLVLRDSVTEELLLIIYVNDTKIQPLYFETNEKTEFWTLSTSNKIEKRFLPFEPGDWYRVNF
jgi:hypothetical protein